MKLNSVKPSIQSVGNKLNTLNTSATRMTGSRLQSRRKRLWTANPYCAGCGRLVAYPGGFELDHIVPLFQGGADTDENCQILCVTYEFGEKHGCHADKTAGEAGER